ncbi:hypothetical protein [Acetobacterium wieringae]|uniref:hypothetical protein n=1 Tax=Acetobacterium wieringae TaxID=52694 RepID=UPI002B1F059C|nr:hypothetical protein [Acetobacterium wieringae]MEA4805091.1 hypothetical protein [Acetobacterium wieringae]
MKDMKNNIKVSNALNIQAIASNTTTAGAIIDTKGFDSLTFVFQTGTITDGDYTLLIHEGDNSGLSDAAAVADADLLGTEALASFTADTDDNKVSKIGYRGNKRYVRLSVVSTNVTTGGTVGAVAIQGHPQFAPVA